MVVVVYTSSASANNAVRNKQKAIIDYLVLHKIEFEEIDLCVHTDAKDVMRSKVPEDIKEEFKANNKPIIPPQVFNDDVYCGDYDMFFNAREMELVHTFFKVTPPPEKKSTMNTINWEKAMGTSELQICKNGQDENGFKSSEAQSPENIKESKHTAADDARNEGGNDGSLVEVVELKSPADDKADIPEPLTKSVQNTDISEDMTVRNSESKSEVNPTIQSDGDCDVAAAANSDCDVTIEANSSENLNGCDDEATEVSTQNEGQHHPVSGSGLPLKNSDDGDMIEEPIEEQFGNLKVGIESNESDQEESSDESQ